MKGLKYLMAVGLAFLIAGTSQAQVEKDSALYQTILHLDQDFFEAYNTCDENLEKYGSYYDEDIEFYHDQGGLMTSKQDIIDATAQNICDKVKRELVVDSMQVYPIKDYGAVQMGYHIFHNLVENTSSEPVKFMVIWQFKNEAWKIKRVVSLH